MPGTYVLITFHGSVTYYYSKQASEGGTIIIIFVSVEAERDSVACLRPAVAELDFSVVLRSDSSTQALTAES